MLNKISHKKATSFVEVLIIIFLVVVGLGLFVLSCINRHTDYITRNPLAFTSELILLGVFGAAPLFYVAWVRGSSYKKVGISYVLLFLKIVIFWVMLELAGVNNIYFPVRQTSS